MFYQLPSCSRQLANSIIVVISILENTTILHQGQLLHNLQQLKKNRNFRFIKKEPVGIPDRLLFPNSFDDSCIFCNSHYSQLFPFWKGLVLFCIFPSIIIVS